jgi:hypothetical protein
VEGREGRYVDIDVDVRCVERENFGGEGREKSSWAYDSASIDCGDFCTLHNNAGHRIRLLKEGHGAHTAGLTRSRASSEGGKAKEAKEQKKDQIRPTIRRR